MNLFLIRTLSAREGSLLTGKPLVDGVTSAFNVLARFGLAAVVGVRVLGCIFTDSCLACGTFSGVATGGGLDCSVVGFVGFEH